jgi:hypothetical protein
MTEIAKKRKGTRAGTRKKAPKEIPTVKRAPAAEHAALAHRRRLDPRLLDDIEQRGADFKATHTALVALQAEAHARGCWTTDGVERVLRVCQGMPDLDGPVGWSTRVYLVGWLVDQIMTGADPATRAIFEELHAANKRHGLADGDAFSLDDANYPADVRAIDARFEARYDEMTVQTMRRFGEGAMADLYERDRATFDKRYEAGRVRIFGP